MMTVERDDKEFRQFYVENPALYENIVFRSKKRPLLEFFAPNKCSWYWHAYSDHEGGWHHLCFKSDSEKPLTMIATCSDLGAYVKLTVRDNGRLTRGDIK